MFTLIIEDKHGGIADEYSFEEGEFYIGRSHTSDIILPSDNVSRRHARLYTVDGKCYIEDLNSSNGVFVNGRRIQEVFQIQRSAQIKVGDYYLHIESDAEQNIEEEKTYCRLTGRNLAFVNQVFRVQRKVNLLGRGKDCTLTIIDPSVSRIHSKLSVERSGALTIEDLKSSNGTFVNDERVEVATLQHRDLLRIGNVEFLVELPEAETIAQAPKAAASASGKPPKPARDDKAARDDKSPKTGKDHKDGRDAPRTSPKKAETAPKKGEPKRAEAEAPSRKGADKRPEPARERPAPAAALASASDEYDYSKPPPPMSPASASNTTSLADELWPDKKESKGGKLLWILIPVLVVVVAVVLMIVFKDSIFGGSSSTPTPTPAPEIAKPTPAGPTPEELAREEQKKKERRQAEIDSIITAGNEFIKAKVWDKARERFEVVLEMDPLNDTARGAVNRIIAWEADKTRLSEARTLLDQLKRGEAAKKLREIGDTSVYFADAQRDLLELMSAKSTLEMRADNELRGRDCEAALATLRELQLIDPKDAAISVKLDDVQKLVGTRRCK